MMMRTKWGWYVIGIWLPCALVHATFLEDPFVEATKALSGISLKKLELYPGLEGYEVKYDKGSGYCGHFKPRSEDQKIYYLVQHYTACNYPSTLKTFTFDPSLEKNNNLVAVSAHYVVTEQEKIIDKQERSWDIPAGKIVQVVPPDQTAFHAGISQVGSHTRINPWSLGIENVGKGYQELQNGIKWCPFDESQMMATARLTAAIVEEYKLPWWRIRGYDDVAFVRHIHTKVDPGPLFSWGTVVPSQPKPVCVQHPTLCTNEEGQEARTLLKLMGYGGTKGIYDPESDTMKEDFLPHQFNQAV